jgi:hypothetical protein
VSDHTITRKVLWRKKPFDTMKALTKYAIYADGTLIGYIESNWPVVQSGNAAGSYSKKKELQWFFWLASDPKGEAHPDETYSLSEASRQLHEIYKQQTQEKGGAAVATAYEQLVQRIKVGHPQDTAAEMIRLLDKVVADTRRDQAQVDAELMQKNADRAPKAPAPKGGTTSRAVFTEAARMLHPDVLGWSLELPEHLREGEK